MSVPHATLVSVSEKPSDTAQGLSAVGMVARSQTPSWLTALGRTQLLVDNLDKWARPASSWTAKTTPLLSVAQPPKALLAASVASERAASMAWPGVRAAVLSEPVASRLGLTAKGSAIGVLNQERFVGLVGARKLQARQLAVTAGVSGLISSGSRAAAWQQGLLTGSTARALQGTVVVPSARVNVLADIVRVNSATSALVARYAEQNTISMRRPATSARSTLALRELLAHMPVEPTASDLTRAALASRAVAGLTAADLVVAPGVLDPDAVQQLDEDVVDPWVSGPQEAREALFEQLHQLDPMVPAFLKAAWSQVQSNGPAAAEMAANAVVEAIDRTLRAAAPEPDVLAAAERGELGKHATYMRGDSAAPTRRGRVSYVLMSRQGHTSMVSQQVEALAKSTSLLVDNLQAGKHESPVELLLVQTYLMAAEAIFVQLLLDGKDA